MKEYLYFHWADYTIFGAFLLLFTFIGVLVSWLDRKKTSAKDYLTGGGQSHWTMVGLSMQATFLSAIFILSGPGEIYTYGTVYCYICIGIALAMPIAARFFLPVYYRLNIISAYEYLEKRFNRTTRILASVIFCLQIVFYLSVVLYAPALALSQATGFSIVWSITFCGAVCTTYTCLGGMKATIWNDSIQMCIIYTGLIVVIIKGTLVVGGVEELLNINRNGKRIVVQAFQLDPTIRVSFWSQTFGGLAFFLSCYATSQTIIQKVLGCKSMAMAKKSLYLSMISTIAICFLVTAFGMVAYAFYHKCDPLSSGRINKIDQIVPLIIIELLGGNPGLPGLLMASAFSAALSSMSGCLNSLSAVILTDFILPIYNRKSRVMNERLRVHLSKAFVLSFGILSTFMSFQAHFLGESVMLLSGTVLNSTGGPMLGLLVLGILVPRVNGKGAIAGFSIGFLLTFWIAMGGLYSGNKHETLPMNVDGCSPTNGSHWLDSTVANLHYETTIASEPTSKLPMYLYRLSFNLYGVVGFIITFTVGVLFSLLPGQTNKVDPNLVYRRRKSKRNSIDDVDRSDLLGTSLDNFGEACIVAKVDDQDKMDLNGNLRHELDEDELESEEK